MLNEVVQMQELKLSERKQEELNDQPQIENVMYISLDKRWFIHKTIITDIKPLTYMKKVFEDD
jgi:hypothetical protein